MKQKDIQIYNIHKKIKSYIQIRTNKTIKMQTIQKHIIMEQPVLTTGNPICGQYPGNFSNSDWKQNGSFENKHVNMS